MDIHVKFDESEKEDFIAVRYSDKEQAYCIGLCELSVLSFKILDKYVWAARYEIKAGIIENTRTAYITP